MDAVSVPDAMIARALAGDEEAFGVVVQAYYSRVYHVIYRVVQHPEDAQELAQATWVKVWQRRDDFQQTSQFFTWIYRIAVNTGLDFLRKRKRRAEVTLEVPTVEGDTTPSRLREELADRDTPVDAMRREEIREAFDAALARLSPEHRAALVLREVEGLSYDDIAKAMNTRKGTVMSRLFYARRAMQETMEPFL